MKRYKQLAITLLTLLCILVSLPFNLAWGDNVKDEKGGILLISSYSPIKEDGNHIIASFIRNMRSNTDDQIHVEYMDSESSPAFGSWVTWMEQLFSAYKVKPDVVVLLGGEAWSAYRTTCIEEWRNIPVVLGCVKELFVDYENLEEQKKKDIKSLVSFDDFHAGFKVTGYHNKDYILNNLELIKHLQPQIEHVAFCYDNRYSLGFYKDFLENLFKNVDALDLCYLSGSDLSTTQLLDSMAWMDDSYAILSAGWYTDAARYPHAYSMLHNELSRYTNKPVYQIADQGENNMNYIGGYYIRGSELGKDIANLTYEVLEKGIEQAPLFQETPSKPRYYFNYPTLLSSGVDLDLLPEDAIFYNKKPSIWEERPVEVLLASFVMLLMILVFVGILIARKKKEDAYRIANDRMMALLGTMPDMAIVFDPKLNIIDVVNPQKHVLFDTRWEDLIGVNVYNIMDVYSISRSTADKLSGNVADTQKTGTIHAFNYEYLKDGETFYVKARIVPFGKGNVICFAHDVTAYVVAENEILRLKSFLQSIMDNLPIGLFLKDVTNQYRYLFYNNKVSEFYEEDFGVMLGKNDFEVDDPHAELYRREDEMVLGCDEPVSFDRVFIDDKDGQPKRWGITTKMHMTDREGRKYIIAIVVDTTDIRRNELELENIRQELSMALDAGSMSAWCYDIENKEFVSLYRNTLADSGLTYQDALAMAYPDDRMKYEIFMESLSSGQKEKMQEVFRFKRNGEYGWFETYAIGLKSDKTGKVIQIIGTEKNITGEMQQRQELEENKLKLQFTLEAAQIISWEYNVDTRTFYSPRSTVFDDPLIPLETYLSFVHPEDIPLFSRTLDDLSVGRVKVMDVQIRIRTSRFGDRWFEMHSVAYGRDENGQAHRLIGLRRDITDLKMTNELIRLRDKAEESNRLKSAFLANMSHEIRTPLNAIVGFSNLIAQTEEPDEIGEYVKIIETNNELLLQLINDILDLSKIEAGQLDFNYTNVNLGEVFQNLYQVFLSRVKEGVTLICNLPTENCIIYSEKNRLMQVVSNFLSNACKYTFEGSITMGYERLGDKLRFYVTDTGKGINAENIPHVFERFAKFDSFVQGTGLGLSICESIIESLDGQIGVESEVGKGSTFWFILPYQPATENDVK